MNQECTTVPNSTTRCLIQYVQGPKVLDHRLRELGCFADPNYQIDDYSDVYEQDTDFDRGDVLAELIKLQRDQTSSGDDCEVFRPSFPKNKSSSLGQEKSRVDECSDTRLSELLRTD